MYVIRNVEVFDPSPRGNLDVWIAGREVLAITAPGDLNYEGEEVDATGCRLIPGLVDALTHPCGGGGEGGFGNRTEEISPETFIRAGVLTPVAALGTDSVGRSLDVLYGNVMALNDHGIGALMYSGSYRCPVPTLTGDVVRDLYLVEPVIGVGEVAIADHRGSQPSVFELRRLGADTSLGGTLTGRGGTVLVHVGAGEGRLALLREAVAESELHPSVFYPTHVNRSPTLLAEAVEWAKSGGYVDITVSTTPELIEAGDIPADVALRTLLEGGAPSEQITLSSDAGGSLPLYVNGELEGLTAASPDCLLALLGRLYGTDTELHAVALRAMTSNPAAALNLSDRGRLIEGGRADLVLVDNDGHQVRKVMGNGRWLSLD